MENVFQTGVCHRDIATKGVICTGIQSLVNMCAQRTLEGMNSVSIRGELYKIGGRNRSKSAGGASEAYKLVENAVKNALRRVDQRVREMPWYHQLLLAVLCLLICGITVVCLYKYHVEVQIICLTIVDRVRNFIYYLYMKFIDPSFPQPVQQMEGDSFRR